MWKDAGVHLLQPRLSGSAPKDMAKLLYMGCKEIPEPRPKRPAALQTKFSGLLGVSREQGGGEIYIYIYMYIYIRYLYIISL